jgi:thiamine pyrophosphokinase
MRSAIVVCAGGPARRALPAFDDGTLVIAADSGAVEAQRLGLRVDRLVGDLDSAPAAVVTRLEASGVPIDRYPADKDASDLELALEIAVAEGADELLVVGGDGGRLDHLLGAAFLLGSDRWRAVRIDAVLGDALVHVVRGRRSIAGDVGELVSLFAVGGAAEGVSTTGLRWPLRDDAVSPGSTRGLSNEFVETTATVSVRAGVVLAIRPGSASP